MIFYDYYSYANFMSDFKFVVLFLSVDFETGNDLDFNNYYIIEFVSR